MQRYPMTVQGAEALKAELNKLKTVDRPAVTAAIAEARAHGDLKENAEYAAAREEHGFNEGRIAEIEAKLSNATIVDPAALPKSGKVVFSSTVELADADSGDELRYQIVGEDEADIKKGLISVNSPIARALIGKSEGDIAQVQTPRGVRELEVVKVSYL